MLEIILECIYDICHTNIPLKHCVCYKWIWQKDKACFMTVFPFYRTREKFLFISLITNRKPICLSKPLLGNVMCINGV